MGVGSMGRRTTATTTTCPLFFPNGVTTVVVAQVTTSPLSARMRPRTRTCFPPLTPTPNQVAKWVADAVTHSLYHGLLEVKCVPFLPHEPVSRYSLDLVPVSYVMHSPVVTLRTTMKVGGC